MRMKMEIVAAVAGTLILLLMLRVVITRKEAYPSASLPSGASAPPTEESIRELLLRGRKIEAIKAYRQARDADLMTAKEAVERLARELPRES